MTNLTQGLGAVLLIAISLGDSFGAIDVMDASGVVRVADDLSLGCSRDIYAGED